MEAGIQQDPKLWEELRLTADPVAELIRFAKGYYYNQFKKLPEAERMRLTIRILRRCLIWRQQNQVAKLSEKVFPRRAEFNRLWVSGVSGLTAEGRVVYTMVPPSSEIMDKFTQDEVAWMHFQENEWLVRLKAEVGRKRNKLILDHIVLVDFGDNATLKFHSVSLGMVNWFRMAIKWEPPDMDPGEEPMDVDGYCYPESLYRMYVINCSMPLRAVWNAAKHFVYPSTREKFRIMGSDMDAIMKQFAADGVSLSALPAYLGGTGLNPPGLVLQCSLKANDTCVVKAEVPPDHVVVYRFRSSKGASILGTDSTGTRICDIQAGTDWQEGSVQEQKEAGTLSFKFACTSSTSVNYEITVQPRTRLHPTPSPSPVSTSSSSTPKTAVSVPWVTKRRMFRESVRSLDMTPLEPRKGPLSKWGSWHTGYQHRFFQVNNEYLNYFADEQSLGTLLGSYNLRKLQKVDIDSKGSLIILNFDGKNTVWLRAPNEREAQLWVTCLEARRRWYDEITLAQANSSPKDQTPPTQAAPAQTPAQHPRGKHKPRQETLSLPLLLFLCLVCVFVGIFIGMLLG